MPRSAFFAACRSCRGLLAYFFLEQVPADACVALCNCDFEFPTEHPIISRDSRCVFVALDVMQDEHRPVAPEATFQPNARD